MKNWPLIISKILKIIAGTVIGLVLSLLILWSVALCFRDQSINVWAEINLFWIVLIIAVSVFICIGLFLWLPFEIFKRKISTSGFEDLDEIPQKFIDAVIDSMKYRYKARCDVRQELTDHFTDAMRDCKTEQDRQQVINELIIEFGDPKMLGLLVRRGKKRCRPMWQQILFLTPQFIGVCIILFILYVGWFLTGKPEVETNYLEIWNQIIKPVSDENLNASPYYLKAVQLYNMEAIESFDKSSSGSDEKFYTSPRALSELTTSEQALIERWVKSNQPALEQIRLGNDKPYYWGQYLSGGDDSTELIFMLTPHLRDYRNISYLLCWQAILYADHCQYDKSFGCVYNSLVFGQRIKGQKTTLIEQLVASAIQRVSNNTLRLILSESGDDINPEQLASLSNRFAELTKFYDYKVDYSGEILFIKDEAQRCFVESKFGPDHLYLRGMRTLAGVWGDSASSLPAVAATGYKVLFSHPNKDQTLETVDHLYSLMVRVIEKTPAERKVEEYSINDKIEEICKNNIFLAFLFPALEKVVDMSYANKIDTQATVVVIALQRYRKQFGKYPANLNVLVQEGLITDVPNDPFSGRPLIYKNTDQGVKLYSVGMNLMDDGGTTTDKIWSQEGDVVFWTAE